MMTRTRIRLIDVLDDAALASNHCCSPFSNLYQLLAKISHQTFLQVYVGRTCVHRIRQDVNDVKRTAKRLQNIFNYIFESSSDVTPYLSWSKITATYTVYFENIENSQANDDGDLVIAACYFSIFHRLSSPRLHLLATRFGQDSKPSPKT